MDEVRFCRGCRRETLWKPGKALKPTVTMGVPDFPGDDEDSRGQTLSYGGPGQMVEVIKCSECGRSIQPPTEAP